MYIPELAYSPYALIVMLSIILGIVVACILMRRAGASRQTVFYTALLTFVMIIAVSFLVSFYITHDIRRVGFVGAGGALGLVLGVLISAFIHNDHPGASVSAWVVSAPLMYGLSKIGCHIAGCCHGIPYTGPLAVTYACHGDASCFPVQLLETVVFLVIFAVGLALYLHLREKLPAALITVAVSCAAKVLLEFLHESHTGGISGYQILVMSIAAAFAAVTLALRKKLSV